MAVLPFLAIHFVMKFVAVIFVICAIMLILLILVQKGKGGGLSGAFGGAGTASGVFGSKTGDRLTWFTIVLVGIFLTLAVVMAKFYRPKVSQFGETPAVEQTQSSTNDTDAGTSLPRE